MSKGNLRDFQINSTVLNQPTQNGSALNSGHRPAVRAPVSATASPKQSVKMKTTTLTEWNDTTYAGPTTGGTPSGEDLWSSWDNELAENLEHVQTRSQRQTQSTSVQTAKPAEMRVQKVQAPAPESNLEEIPLSTPTLTAAETHQLPWAARLALDERRMERTGVVDFTNSYQKHEIMKVRTMEFMGQLHKSFREHIEIFNENRGASAQALRIYRISNTEEDFMLFRNGVKLIVSGQRSGKVIFAFSQYLGQLFAPSQNPTVEIEATFGPFDQLYWSFKGERVSLLDIVRYFITEFTKQSVR